MKQYVILSGDYVERRVVEREMKPNNQGLEYYAKCFEFHSSVGNRKPLKDYELRNEMYRLFCYLFLIW